MILKKYATIQYKRDACKIMCLYLWLKFNRKTVLLSASVIHSNANITISSLWFIASISYVLARELRRLMDAVRWESAVKLGAFEADVGGKTLLWGNQNPSETGHILASSRGHFDRGKKIHMRSQVPAL